MNAAIQTLATKEDVEFVKIDMLLVKSDLAAFKYEFSKGIHQAKVSVLKWIFFFGITQIIATSLIFILLLKK